MINWSEMRQSWLKSAKKMTSVNNLFNVRVLYKHMDYYGKLEVFPDKLTILPDDLEIDTIMFFDSHFRGGEPIIDDEKKVFQFRFNFKSERRTPLIICVKGRDVLDKLEAAVSELFG